MTLPRWERIVERWNKVPPLAVSVAAIAEVLGVEREPTKTPAPHRDGKPEQDFTALFDMFGMTPGFAQGKPQWLKEAEAMT